MCRPSGKWNFFAHRGTEFQSALLICGRGLGEGPRQSEAPEFGCYGLTGTSCNRLFESSVATMARVTPDAIFAKTFVSPGGVSEERCGSPRACAGTERASAITTADPSETRGILEFRILSSIVRAPGAILNDDAHDVRPMRCVVHKSGPSAGPKFRRTMCRFFNAMKCLLCVGVDSRNDGREWQSQRIQRQ